MNINNRSVISPLRMSSSGTHGAGGVSCCCFRCCTCIHIEFFKSLPGIVKIMETVSNYNGIRYLMKYGKYEKNK